MDNQGEIINIMKNMNGDWGNRAPHLKNEWTFPFLSEFLFKERIYVLFYNKWG